MGGVPARPSSRLFWQAFALLMTGALVGVVAVLPYTLTVQGALLSRLQNQLPPLWILLPLQVAQSLVVIGLATALGLWLGPKVGLGAPLLHRLLGGDQQARTHLRALVVPSATLGVLVALVIVALDLWVFGSRLPTAPGSPSAVQPPPWQGLLASFYGAVPEELLLRLGLMTFLVWVGARLTRATVPGRFVLWAAIVVTALVFGLAHLPATAAVLPLTPLVVARALLLNGLGGLLFGWLYWRRGLLAAMMAHFSADVVLHVVVPLLRS